MFIKIDRCYNKSRSHGQKPNCSSLACSWVGDGHERVLGGQSVRVHASEWLIDLRQKPWCHHFSCSSSITSFLLSLLPPWKKRQIHLFYIALGFHFFNVAMHFIFWHFNKCKQNESVKQERLTQATLVGSFQCGCGWSPWKPVLCWIESPLTALSKQCVFKCKLNDVGAEKPFSSWDIFHSS